MLDELDFALIEKLQQNGRKPITQISRELGRPTPTVRDRLRHLERMGIIQGYTAVIDVAKIGFPIKALVHINTLEQAVDQDAFLDALGQIPEVASADLITGDYEAEVTVYVRDIEHLSRILYGDLRQVPGVTGTNTSIVLRGHRWQIPRQSGSLPTGAA